MSKPAFTLKMEQSQLCPVDLLQLDDGNPRLQTGVESNIKSEEDLIEKLSDIAALDELITSIVTNKYLNLEPMIVIGSNDKGPFRVLEGNRRLAAIKVIRDKGLAKKVKVKVPETIPGRVISSTNEILCFRVKSQEDARAFIGFKHINGPQRWDAYAKARYVAAWYKKEKGKISISEISDRMGDTNDTLQLYIYSILILDQASAHNIWKLSDRATKGRFAFSHFYTAIGRKEYQEFLGLNNAWSETPELEPISKAKLKSLGEVLSYIYGSKETNQSALVTSQNPDLKDLGFALVNKEAHLILRNKGTLDEARDALRNPNDAFNDAVTAANIRLGRALALISKYDGSDLEINKTVEEIYERADTVDTMIKKKKGYVKSATK